MSTLSRPSVVLGGIAALSLSAVAAALFTQHVWDMQPCPWCVLQRLIFVAIALAAVLGLVWRSLTGFRLSMLLILAFSLAGVAAALWQHFVASASASCNQTLADRIISATGLDGSLPDIFQARASCADAAAKLGGVPYEFWSLGLFTLFAVIALRCLVASRG